MRVRGTVVFLLGAIAASVEAQTGERITIPAAASIVGAAPFFSDVRVFNTSHSTPAEVTATYRCFLGACPGTAIQENLTLAPRQSLALDDIVAVFFGAPNSGGGVEFDVAAPLTASDVVVTSRLYSTEPVPTVGMFIPGVLAANAHRHSVLSQISNGGADQGFRTNVGAFNGQDTPAAAIFALYSEGHWVGEVERTIPAHSGVQINDFFGPNGINHPLLATSDSVVAVRTDGPAIFSYAAVIDNATTDPIFVTGASDVPPLLSVGGAYSTDVTLGQNTCGNVTVQDNPTTVVQTPASHTVTLTHVGVTYEGTVQDDGSFVMQPENVSGGGESFTITIEGQFTPPGFTAVVRVDRTAPSACFYVVDWVGLKSGGANFFP